MAKFRLLMWGDGMFDNPFFAGMVIFAIFAFSEWLSIVSRARIPMLFTAMMVYLILLWLGVIPKDISQKAYFLPFASLLPALLIVHMGTLIPFEQIKEQYKAILISLAGITVATLLIFATVVPLFDYTTAASGIGPLTGGTIAFIITAEKLTELGLVDLITVPAAIIAVQGLIGMPLANFFLRRRGKKIVKALRENQAKAEIAATVEQSTGVAANKKEKRVLLPKKYQTNIILLFQVFIGATLAVFLESVTGISYSLWALAIGIIGSYFGFYVGTIMERANSFGVLMALLIVLIISSLNDVTPSMFTSHLPAIITILGVGVIGILIGGYFTSKFFKWDPDKGVPVALTALIGFPGDYILCEEVSRSVGKTEEEQKAIFNEIITPMLIGGFTTVTVASVVIAGILMSTL